MQEVDGSIPSGSTNRSLSIHPVRSFKVLVLAAVATFASTLVGAPSSHASMRVVGVFDGDTLTVLDGRHRSIVRLVEIDAPEHGQPFADRSKKSLVEICLDKPTTLAIKGTDSYGRRLARVSCAGVDANREQVRRGMAWVYDRYVVDRSLYNDQERSKSAQRGLWADRSPTPPWDWRHQNELSLPTRAGESTNGCRIKGNISSNGERIYHVPGQKYYASTQINESAGERWFCTGAQARSAGWRAAKI